MREATERELTSRAELERAREALRQQENERAREDQRWRAARQRRSGGRSRSIPPDHVVWVMIGPSTPPVTRRSVSRPTPPAQGAGGRRTG